MKTTIEIPDELFRRTKAMAALRGESLKTLVTQALEKHLERLASRAPSVRGWRSVFGKAQAKQVAQVDARVAKDLERIDPEDWR